MFRNGHPEVFEFGFNGLGWVEVEYGGYGWSTEYILQDGD